MSFEDQVLTCAGLLRDGQRVLEQTEPNASIDFLEGIAKVKCALRVVAKILHRQPSMPITMAKVTTQPSSYVIEREAQQLLMSFTSIDSDCNSILDPSTQLLLAAQSACHVSLTVGPSNYLLKLIVRQFGFFFLRKLVKVHPWVIPKDIMWKEKVCYV